MNITCPICPVIKNNVLGYLTDAKYIFSNKFIPNNYHKHLGYSLVLTIPSILGLIFFFDLDNVGVLFQLFMGGFGAYIVNWLRERHYAKKYNAPWDQVDIHMGSYGGILGAAIAILIYHILK
jgi:uncharacterized membrane protein YeaQ/YmgE (transglycosylase-associated protein family)